MRKEIEHDRDVQAAVNKKATSRFELVFKALKEQQLRISTQSSEHKSMVHDHKRIDREYK